MAARIDVVDVAALRTFEGRLGRSATTAAVAFDRLDRLAAALVQRAEAELARRRRALEDCLRSEEGRCDGLAAAVEEARAALARLNAARSAARASRRALDRHINEEVPRARDFMKRVAASIDAVDGPARGSAVAAGVGAAASVAGAAGSASASSPASSGLPEGFELVPISSIDTSDSGVHGPSDFNKGYTPEDLAWALDALDNVILPGLRAGRGPDHFAALDAERGLVGSRSYRDTYDGFFGGDAIRLDGRGDGALTVGNGYHRIWVAIRSGRSWVPARVTR